MLALSLSASNAALAAPLNLSVGIAPSSDFPSVGPAGAPVTIVAFGGFQCSHCGRLAPVLKKLQAERPDDVRLVFVHKPLGFHRQAMASARAAVAAHRQGAFWPMYHQMMRHQKQLSRGSYERWAAQLGLARRRFLRDMASARTGEKIARDLLIAERLGVNGTPALLINGRRVTGYKPIEVLRPLVDAELRAWASALDAGIDANDVLAHRVRRNNPAIVENYVQWLIRGHPPSLAARPPTSGHRGAKRSNLRVPRDSNDGVLGSPQPLVTMVIFADYACRFSKRGNEVIQRLLQSFAGDLQVRVKHLPHSFHRHARHAAVAAVCAHRQGRFAAMHRLLFRESNRLHPQQVLSLAQTAGVDMRRFRACSSSPGAVAAVDRHMEQAKQVGARGTPVWFVNGVKITGAQPGAVIAREIEVQRARAKKLLSAGKVKRSALYAWMQRDAKFVPSRPLVSGPTFSFATAGRPSLGNPASTDASIVVFGELSCPFCVALLPKLAAVVRSRPQERIALLHYPLSPRCNNRVTTAMHPAACDAAMWLEAAAKQGKTAAYLAETARRGPYHFVRAKGKRRRAKARARLLFELKETARAAGMNLRAARRFIKRSAARSIVGADVRQASGANVRGTPTIFVRGRRYVGPRAVTSILRALDKP